MEFSQIDIFQSLTNSELNEISKIAKKMHLGRDELVFSEGAFERNIYIIETGQIEIFKKTPIHGDQTLAVLKSGDYFGEMAFFEKTASRSASAKTKQATNLFVIEGNDFEKLLHTHPSISLKLLATLSQRLRESNVKIAHRNVKEQNSKSGLVVTVASAKDGYGKSTFATSLAELISAELRKKTLFIDLDLYFGGATQLFGIHSPKSIIDINKKFVMDEIKFDLVAETVKIKEHLHGIPAPRSFLEAEQVHAHDIARIIKRARQYYDYILIDTGSNFDENLFTALDTADYIFFLLDFSNLATITDNVRYFQGISKLGYPRERMILLANNIGSDFSTSKSSKVFPYPIIGGLPKLTDTEPQFSKTTYVCSPSSPYCEMLRLLVRNVFKETSLQKPQGKGSIFSMFFSDKDPEKYINLQLGKLQHQNSDFFSPVISSKDVRSQVKYVRFNLMFGYIDEALNNLLAFMEHTPDCGSLLELYGEIMLIKEDSSQALEAFQKAVSKDPERHLALGYLAALTGDQKSLDTSISKVKAQIEKNPTHLDLINDFGKILMKNQRYEEAIKQFQAALEKNPGYLDAKINYSLCLAEIEKYDQAIGNLLNMENKSPRIFFVLGEIFYKSGRLFLAYKSLSMAAKIYPTYPKMGTKLNELLNYIKKLESLIDLHERFTNTNPTFPDLHAKLGNFYHLAGKSELAIQEYETALEINPDYEYARLKLDSVKKDMIWRLAKTHLEETPINSETITRELIVDVHCECKNLRKNHFPDDIVLQIKNIRTSKIMQKAVSIEQIEEGFARFNCAPLGLVASHDVLIFQVLNVKSKKVLRFEPYYVTVENIKSSSCKVTLEIDMEQESCDDILPKYFLVHFNSKQFAETISGNPPLYSAFLTNKKNGIKANGHLNPENSEQINFVLNGDTSNKSSAAVTPGDMLEVKIEDSMNNEVFSMEFAVGRTDVENFYKTIVPQEIS